MPARAPAILFVVLSLLGLLGNRQLDGIRALVSGPEPAIHHVHEHTHGGATHVHGHRHALPHGSRNDVREPRSEGDDHHYADDHRGGGDGVPAVAPRPLRTFVTGHALAIESPMPFRASEQRASRVWRPPARAGPPDHLIRLRTVMLLT